MLNTTKNKQQFLWTEESSRKEGGLGGGGGLTEYGYLG